ncbi:MarR family winged helix-turn-helix transcriptional regulator [Cellulomonas sp. HZM]|uniref:MarR family winged helix-turn-helix transcriptional regulator n=1 Tax=Cellulomonas sp. HZM TaxID=1454010 RepID=UPI000493B4DB|nr:MarR family transcriptional regulator [Cellulomonas sp. HZM]
MTSTTVDPAAADDPTTSEPFDNWLSTDEQVSWRAFRDGVVRLFAALEHDLEQRTGLSSAEYEVLVRLSEAPGRTSRMSGLADDLAHSRSRLTHTIRRMEERGLVVRAQCSADARGVNCTMTELGWTTLVAAAPQHVQSVRDRLVDVLTPEQFAALGTAMAAVRDRIASGPCHAPCDA